MDLSQLIIEPETLAKSIESQIPDSICIVDLSSEQSYLNGHVPGAVHLPFQALLCGQAPAPGKIASKAQLERVFSYLGLNEDTHFIVYDDEGGGWAGRFIWTLDVIGHTQYSYLNGGLHAWNQAGLTLEQQGNTRTETSVNLHFDETQLVEIEDILKGLEDKSITIWDARSAAEYSGQRILANKGGHIPGAKHCEWTDLMDQAKGLKIREDAQAFLEARGINHTQTLITHCQSHHRSGFTYLVGKSLGFDIKAYHGSWSEWGNADNTPVEL